MDILIGTKNAYKAKKIIALIIISFVALIAFWLYYSSAPLTLFVRTDNSIYKTGEEIKFTITSNKLTPIETSLPLPIIEKLNSDGSFEAIVTSVIQCRGNMVSPPTSSPRMFSVFNPEVIIWDQTTYDCTQNAQVALTEGKYRAKVMLLSGSEEEFYSEEFDIGK
jgi:hypothetical protein